MLKRRKTNCYLRSQGSSFSELLVVVLILVIIATLFAFGSHHLLIRAKYTKVLEDQRQLGGLLERYQMEYEAYPSNKVGLEELKEKKYLTKTFADPFSKKQNPEYFYFYKPFDNADDLRFLLVSPGPDGKLDIEPYLNSGYLLASDDSQDETENGNVALKRALSNSSPNENTKLSVSEWDSHLATFSYDPTNGLSSNGDIIYYPK